MALNLKELSKQEDFFVSGHRACAGCGPAIAVRQALLASGKDTVVGFATGCMEVVSTIFPYTAWNVSYIHSLFENVAATISGVEAAYKALKKKGKIKKKINLIAFGGDGGTYDIGLQSLSGVMERRHNMLYICYDNQAYMNTGIQRSGATPYGASTTTSPSGKASSGKPQWRKDIAEIMVAHNIPYVAQASVSDWKDYMGKVEKALSIEGPKFMVVFAPCQLGWYYRKEDTIKIADLAVKSRFWPLYEVENGVHKITKEPKKVIPVEEWLKLQGRFRHLFKDENKKIIEEIQKQVDARWEKLKKLEAAGI
jgi:pyruvate ferredoxin oxidoreductase beta subunit